MIVLWRCPDCERPIRLSVAPAPSLRIAPNTYRATVDTHLLELAMVVHERSHAR